MVLQTDEFDHNGVGLELGLLCSLDLSLEFLHHRLFIPVGGDQTKFNFFFVQQAGAVLHHSHYFEMLPVLDRVQVVFEERVVPVGVFQLLTGFIVLALEVRHQLHDCLFLLVLPLLLVLEPLLLGLSLLSQESVELGVHVTSSLFICFLDVTLDLLMGLLFALHTLQLLRFLAFQITFVLTGVEADRLLSH